MTTTTMSSERRLGPVGPGMASVRPKLAAELAQAHPASIHRGFFRGAIAVVLTLGAVWGAILLLRIGFLGSFTSVRVQEVNAHGHAMIFGWVGLFVMGFAYQMIPRFKHASLAYPKLARATLGMMIAGILLRSGLEPLVASRSALLAPAMAGNMLEIAAVAFFFSCIAATMRSAVEGITWRDKFLLSALGWFFVQTVYETFYFMATAVAPTHDALLALIATWQAPLRDVQIHGFALLMIFGVSLRVFPAFYGLRAISQRRGRLVLWLVNLAVVGEVLGLVFMRTMGTRWAALWMVAALALVAACVLFVTSVGVFRRFENPDRSAKFFRTAYAWLLLSMGMLLLLPAWQFGVLPLVAPESRAVEIGFSHAYYGAIRHAVTVGFISLMIMGMAARVVADWEGLDRAALPSLMLPFLLVNTGCAMRVGFQALTDAAPGAFPLAGISGVLEVTGLAIWGMHIVWMMRGRVQRTLSSETCAAEKM